MSTDTKLSVRVAEAQIEDEDLVLRIRSDEQAHAFLDRLRQSAHRDPKWVVGTIGIPFLALVLSVIIVPWVLQRVAMSSQRNNDDFAARRDAADAVAAATAPFLAEIEFFVSPRTNNEGLDRFGVQRVYNNAERAWLASAALADAKLVGLYEDSDDARLVATWQDFSYALRRLHRLSSYVEDEGIRLGWYEIVGRFFEAYAQPGPDPAAVDETEPIALADAVDAGDVHAVASPGRCDASTISVEDTMDVVEGRRVGASGGARNNDFQAAFGRHLEVFSACRDQLVRQILSAETVIPQL